MGQYDRQAQSQRKHGPIISSSSSRAGVLPPSQKPQWRGSGYVKKRAPKQPLNTPSTKPNYTIQDQLLPTELQQLILNVFRDAFLVDGDFEVLMPVLKRVSELVSRRDFGEAFGSEEQRRAFAARWAPSRSLAYANALAWLCETRPDDSWVTSLLSDEEGPAKVVCFGGGAAEVMAVAGLARQLRPEAAGKPAHLLGVADESTAENPADPSLSIPLLDLKLVDAADWSSVVSILETGLSTPPTLSKYASVTARANNAALLASGAVKTTFHHTGIFELSTDVIHDMIGLNPVLVTLFLTLNDFYMTSIPKTTAFLRKLEASMSKDSLLLVVDNIGASATSTTVDGPNSDASQSYPMDWLLDRVLLGKPQKDDSEDDEARPKPRWEKVVQEPTTLHKLNEKLRYPGSLENIKFQMHVFKRV